MYCGQCGKKVMDNMLFCPFCGSPIVIPEQDEPQQPAVKAAPVKEAPVIEAPVKAASVKEAAPAKETIAEPQSRQISLFEDAPREEEAAAEDEEFEPLSFSFDDDDEAFEEEEIVTDAEFEAAFGEDDDEDEESEEEEIVPDFLLVEEESIEELEEEEAEDVESEPVKKPVRSRPQKAPEMNRRRENKTYIPVKEVDMDNLFMDEESLEEEDEYDLPDDFDEEFENEFEFEEPEEGSFVQRHIRGIVGLILMLVLVIIILIWAMSGKGQITLAKFNLAWDPEVYADLGYEAYQEDSDLLAARYYEKALAREPGNYDYAHSAMVAYYEADRIESAASMLKKCVELRPDSAEPYKEMLILYPDAANRPWEIKELIRMGYERTGDAALNIQ